MVELRQLPEARDLGSFPEGLSRFRAHASDLTFGSRSECACAFFLERYGRGWRCIDGATFHIKIATKEVDFYIPEFDTYIEYHPIQRYDWRDSEASRRYGEHFRKLSPAMKRESWEIEKLEFARRYYDLRRLVLDLTEHKESSLIVAQSDHDFYRQVLRGLFDAPLSERAFLREWASVINSL